MNATEFLNLKWNKYLDNIDKEGKYCFYPKNLYKLMNEFQALKQSEVSEWVSVEDRLPESRDRILVYDFDDDDIVVCEYINNKFIFTEAGLDITKFITYWQPLPTPPKTS